MQALLRNPVNIKEGYGRNARLHIENEEPELTLEFEESEIEESNHCRALTLNSESFYCHSHKRHTLSSGKELIMAVTSKLTLKVQKTEKKFQNLASKFQNLAETLYKESEENFKIQQENCELMNEYKKLMQKASK